MRANWDVLYQDKYKLSEEQIKKAVHFSEFANGGAQVTIKLKNGQVIGEVLVSNASYVIAIKGCHTMPFSIDEVDEIYQSTEDKKNEERTKWTCWDE